jgi:hypothetical protein
MRLGQRGDMCQQLFGNFHFLSPLKLVGNPIARQIDDLDLRVNARGAVELGQSPANRSARASSQIRGRNILFHGTRRFANTRTGS